MMALCLWKASANTVKVEEITARRIVIIIIIIIIYYYYSSNRILDIRIQMFIYPSCDIHKLRRLNHDRNLFDVLDHHREKDSTSQ
jgi:hypothetical protein